uniref:Uncharacterized protein n=1 Tax=Arundo donax TaxID=35708 RepID=A0A0A8Z8W9_ARUDO
MIVSVGALIYGFGASQPVSFL